MNTKQNQQSGILPVLALRDQVMLPDVFLPVTIGRTISINSVMHAVNSTNNQIILVTQKNIDVEQPSPQEDLHTIGTLCNIRQVTEIVGNAYKIYIEGIQRVKIQEWIQKDSMISCRFENLETKITDTIQSKAHVKTIISSFTEYIKLKGYSQEGLSYINKVEDETVITNVIANNLEITSKVKQEFLEETNFIKQLEILLDKIDYENTILTIEKQLRTKSNQAQKERLLEQISAIQSKLGNEFLSDADHFMKLKKDKGSFPNQALEDEFNKAYEIFKYTNRNSPEYDALKTYIDTLLKLPTESCKINNNVKQVLEKFSTMITGQMDVQEMISRWLAIETRHRRLGTEQDEPQIICFHGSPGVGKTAMAKAIAKSMDLPFASISLGGMSDIAGLKGHRRTYVGSIYGQIIQAFIRTKVTNPVILLDEIDKIIKSDANHTGPESVLLELLDPDNNHSFTDYYINAPYDVSKAIFITTANDVNALHSALRNRLNKIQIPPYHKEDKIRISQNQIWPSIVKNHQAQHITISDAALGSIISDYTREGGVRELRKKLETISSIMVKKIETGEIPDNKPIQIKRNNLPKLLGPQCPPDQEPEDNKVGVINGLSVSSMGGHMLIVEASIGEGSGQLQITGMAEKIMLESVKIALTNIKTTVSSIKLTDQNDNIISTDFFKKHDFNIHFNEGAVPKDGPSAGITSFIAFLSAITGRAPLHRAAMTGELTLTGNIGGVGGIVEKLMAAYTSECTIAFIPTHNIQYLQKMPKNSMHKVSQDFVNMLEKHNYQIQDKLVINKVASYKSDVQDILDNLDPTNSSKERKFDDVNHESKNNEQKQQYPGLIVVPCSQNYEVAKFVLGLKIK